MLEIIQKISGLVLSIEGSALTIAIVMEMVFRFFPTEKPLTLLRLIASGMKAVGELFIKISDLLDKVLPQKLK